MKKLSIVVLMLITVLSVNANEVASTFIKDNEGFRKEVYLCSAGKATIGYGFTSKVHVNKKHMSEEEASIILDTYINNIKTNVVDKYVTVELTEAQEAVLIDFIYHYGSGAFRESTLLKYINEERGYGEIARQLMRWNKAKVDGKYVTVKGLTLRCYRRVLLWNK